MNLARTLGFLRRWDEAAAGYAQLFERESFANTVTRTIDPEAMREKPELLAAFLEWGVCEREVGIAQHAPDRLSRASAIFETLVLGTRAESRSWWMGKFYQLQTLVDRGEYELAAIALRDIQLHYPDYDAGQFGLKQRFASLGDELARKTFDRPATPKNQ
jgi:hypothetical protein